MEESSPTDTDNRHRATILYVDSDPDRRERVVGAIRAVDDTVRIETAVELTAISEDEHDQADAVVLTHDPPAVDAESAVESLAVDTVFLRAAPAALSDLGETLTAVSDYYLLDAAHDQQVAERVVETATAEYEQNWQAIIDRMTDAFFALDEDWRLTYVNSEAAPILAAAMGHEGADRQTLEGLHFWEEIPEAVDTAFYEQYHLAMDSQNSVRFQEYYPPLDTWFEVRAYPSETGITVYFRDVTERRQQRERLAARERVLREVYSVIADIDKSLSQKVSDLLEMGCDVLGTDYGTLSRVDGEDYIFENVHAPDGQIEAGDVVPLSETNCERTVCDRQTLVLADIERDAPELTETAGFTDWGIACYIGAPVIVDGEVYGTFCFYDGQPREEEFLEWDITIVDLLSQWVSYELERKVAREDLQQQNKRLEQFASIVGHDLRNPLNVASSYLELAQQECDSEHLGKIERAHDRMITLIEDLLVLAREGTDETTREYISLAGVVQSAWTQVETDGATLDIDTEQTLQADPGHLQRILENLFRNAIEHGDGPDHPESAVTITVGDTDGGWYLADDGPGIPPEGRADVFDAGYSTNTSGTGLGLAIVERLASAHGWTVRVTESESGGARFEFDGVAGPSMR